MRSRKSEVVVSPASVNRMWLCPESSSSFSSRGDGCSHLGHGHLWPFSSGQTHYFPSLQFRGCSKQPSHHTVKTLYFQSIFTTKRTEELQNVLKIYRIIQQFSDEVSEPAASHWSLTYVQEIKTLRHSCRIWLNMQLLFSILHLKTYHVWIISSEMHFMGTGNNLH